MSIYTSSTTRITGLSSGMDIDSLVDQLMTAESTKYNRLQQNIQTAQWQQEGYRTLMTEIQSFEDKYFGSTSSSTNLRYSKAFTNYSSSVTTKSGLTSTAVKVTSTTAEATHKLKVNSIATKSSYTSDYNSFSAKSTVTGTKTLDEIQSSAENLADGETLSFKVSYDGTAKEISISKSDISGGKAVGDVINEKLKKAFGSNNGVANVSLSSTSGSDKISLQYSGNGHTLKITSGTVKDDKVTGALSETNFDDGSLSKDVSSVSFKVKVDGKEYSIDVDLTPEENDDGSEGDNLTATNVKTRITNALKEAKLVGGDDDDETTDLSSIVSFSYSSKTGFSIKSASEESGFEITDTGNLSDIVDTSDLSNGTSFVAQSTLNDFGFNSSTSTSYINTSKETLKDLLGIEEDFTLKINDTEITIDADGTFADLMSAINDSDAGVTLSYSTLTNNFTLASTSTGAMSEIRLDDDETADFFSSLGLTTYTAGADAQVEIDGVATTRASNTISLSGVTVEISDTTDDEVTITAENDIDTTYDTIKSFVDDYNTLVTSLRSVITESRTKYDDYTYYEPLTDAQKEEMDEDDIEKWETEAKKGILNNDSYIKNLLTKMRSLLYQSVTLSDGTKMSIYQFGITTTSDTTKGGTLEIDEDKLKSALKENGDSIKEFFTKSTSGLGDQMKTLLESYVGSSGLIRKKAGMDGTVTQNENTLSKKITSLQSKLSDEKTRLTNKETYYYNMFTSMETAISNNNTQMDYITSMLSS
jgi:flagellar hook-associated protein 2